MTIIGVGLVVLGILCVGFSLSVKLMTPESFRNSEARQVWEELEQTGRNSTITNGAFLLGLFFIFSGIGVYLLGRKVAGTALGLWVAILGVVLSLVSGSVYHFLNHPEDPKSVILSEQTRQLERIGSGIESQKKAMKLLMLIGILLVFAGFVLYSGVA